MKAEFIRLFYADNTILNAGTGGDTIAADEIGGVKHQLVKMEFGEDGSATQVSTANPMPVNQPDASATGTIAAADVVVGTPAGDGLLLSGTPTANSYVFCICPGAEASVDIQLTGTFSGTYYFELSLDSTNGIDGKWIATKAKQAGHVQEYNDWKTTREGLYRGNVSGAAYVRVRNIGGSSPSTAVVIRVSAATGGIFMNAPIPEGDRKIGRVSIVEMYPPNLQQISIEGYPVIGALQQTAVGLIARDGAILTGTINFADLGAGKGAYVEEVVITSSGGCPLTWNNTLYTGSFGVNMLPATEVMYGDLSFDGGMVRNAVNRYMLEGSKLTVNMVAIQSGDRPRISVSVRGISYTDDYNYDAKTIALMIGTSCDGNYMGTDPATTQRYRNHWIHMWQVRDLLLDAGKSVRIINKAVVEGESDLWAKQVISGAFGGTNFDLLIINLGTNDALTGSGISTAQFETNLKKLITYRNRFRKDATIIFMDPTPTDTATRPSIASYRTSVANVANDATLGTTARNVYMCSVFAAWVTATGQASGLHPTPASDLNFNDTERSAGNRIHPSGAGMTITANALWATIQTTEYYKKLA